MRWSKKRPTVGELLKGGAFSRTWVGFQLIEHARFCSFSCWATCVPCCEALSKRCVLNLPDASYPVNPIKTEQRVSSWFRDKTSDRLIDTRDRSAILKNRRVQIQSFIVALSPKELNTIRHGKRAFARSWVNEVISMTCDGRGRNVIENINLYIPQSVTSSFFWWSFRV